MQGIIKYKQKAVNELSTETIKAKVFTYEVNEQDLVELSKMQSDEYKINRIFLTSDDINFELVVDNIANGRVLQGGLKDNKYLLNYYIVEKGLDELLWQLMANQ